MTRNNSPSCEIPRTSSLLIILLVALVVVVPRLMLAGGLPTTDEGFYAYYAQVIHSSLISGSRLPDSGPLMLYPLMLNWVFGFDINWLVALRLIDLLVAAVASYILFRVIEKESASRCGAILIGLIFSFAINQTLFIQFGFKNSIHAAYVPLLAGLWLGLNPPLVTTAYRWLGIGALLSFAVLLRETFIPFLVLGALAVLVSFGFRSFKLLVLGAFGTAVLIISAILFARGGVLAFLESYRGAGLLYASVADQRAEFFVRSGGQALGACLVPLFLAGVGMLVTVVRSMSVKRITSNSKVTFWLLVTVLPLVEPATKIGFPYHFGVCLVGLSGLAALGWRNLTEGRSKIIFKVACLGYCVGLYIQIIPHVQSLKVAWPQTREVLAVFNSGQWPNTLIDKSNYLLAAEAIRDAVPQGGTVAVGGFMYTLYPLTGRLPPMLEFSNLTAYLVTHSLSSAALTKALRACPPDVVMSTTRTDWPGSSELLSAIQDTGIYNQITEIPTRTDRSYGNFGGIVFRSTKNSSCN